MSHYWAINFGVLNWDTTTKTSVKEKEEMSLVFCDWGSSPKLFCINEKVSSAWHSVLWNTPPLPNRHQPSILSSYPRLSSLCSNCGILLWLFTYILSQPYFFWNDASFGHSVSNFILRCVPSKLSFRFPLTVTVWGPQVSLWNCLAFQASGESPWL